MFVRAVGGVNSSVGWGPVVFGKLSENQTTNITRLVGSSTKRRCEVHDELGEHGNC
jgi:hypothetical protein